MADRPNIVLLVGEDTGLHLGCYGQPEARTPTLDRLAAEGSRYTHAYTVGPVCAPSRCCMVTGCYPWSIGTHPMRSTLLNPPRLFTHELQSAGYHVAWPTKTDFNFDPPADFCTDKSEWWNGLPNEPFFVYRNFGITHESTMWDANPDHGGGYGNLLRVLPAHLRVDPASVRVPAYLPDVPETRRELARYFEALAMQDLEVGQTLRAIDEAPASVRENTIVIYLTDHGRGIAREKRWCYDAGLHLPLIVRWPDKWRPKGHTPGAVIEDVVSWVDLAPTILALTGTPIPSHYQGQPFVGTKRKYAISGRDRMDESFDRIRTITDGRFRYIRNDFPHIPYAQRNRYQQASLTTQALRRMDADGTLKAPADVYMQRTKPAEELYDASADPDMVKNLVSDPAYQQKLVELRAALAHEMDRFGDLGLIDETELVARGVLKDRIAEYRKRIEPLPEPYHTRTGPTYLTLNEAEAARPVK